MYRVVQFPAIFYDDAKIHPNSDFVSEGNKVAQTCWVSHFPSQKAQNSCQNLWVTQVTNFLYESPK